MTHPLFGRHQRDVVHATISRGPFLLTDTNVCSPDDYTPDLSVWDDAAPVLSTPLVDHRESAAVVTLPAGAEGHIERGEAIYTLAELLEEGHVAATPQGGLTWRMEVGDRAQIELGGYQLALHRDRVEAPGARMPGQDLFEGHLGILVAVSIVAHLIILAAAFMIPVQSYAINLDSMAMRDAFVPVAPIKPDAPELQEQTSEDSEKGDDAGSEDAVAEVAEPQKNRTRRPARRQARTQEPRNINDIGIFGALGQQPKGTLFAGDMSQAAQRIQGGAGATGGELGSPLSGGLPGARRGDPGLSGRFGIADIGLPGVDRERHRMNRDVVLEDKKRDVKVPGRVSPGPVNVMGDRLSRAIIKSRIGSNMARFRYCYEQRLKHSPGLSGRIVINFTIDSTGRVIQARKVASSLGDPQVASCVERGMRAIRFPDFEAGTVVVNYPFMFAPAR